MDVRRREAASHVTRGDEIRDYYDAAHSRIVVTHIPPGHTQQEHRHEVLYDITWVIAGEVEVSEREDEEVTTAILAEGDVAVCAPGPYHNIANRSARAATLLTLKFPRPQGMTPAEFASLCDTDWYPRPPAGGH